jgi:hypothetical protein
VLVMLSTVVVVVMVVPEWYGLISLPFPLQVVGQNIKMLMHSDDAVHHDEYLARYKRTRVRHSNPHPQAPLSMPLTGRLPVLHAARIEAEDRVDCRGMFDR